MNRSGNRFKCFDSLQRIDSLWKLSEGARAARLLIRRPVARRAARPEVRRHHSSSLRACVCVSCSTRPSLLCCSQTITQWQAIRRWERDNGGSESLTSESLLTQTPDGRSAPTLAGISFYLFYSILLAFLLSWLDYRHQTVRVSRLTWLLTLICMYLFMLWCILRTL